MASTATKTDEQKAVEAKAAADKAAAEKAESDRLAAETSAAEKSDAAPKLQSFTVAVHTAVLQVRNPKNDRITDRVLHGGGPPIDLDPDDEFVARLIDLKVLRPTKEVQAERKARQEFREAREKYLASLGELERERIAAATGKPTPGVVEAGQPDAAAQTASVDTGDDVVDLAGPNAQVVPVVAPLAL